MTAAEELSQVKGYMRVDTNEEDALISALLASAKEYLANAGITEPEGPSALYQLAVWGLTLHYYDSREAAADGAKAEMPLGLRTILTQLKLSAGLE